MNRQFLASLIFSTMSCILAVAISNKKLTNDLQDIRNELVCDIKKEVLSHLIDEIAELEQKSLGFHDGQGNIVASKTDDDDYNQDLLDRGFVFAEEPSC